MAKRKGTGRWRTASPESEFPKRELRVVIWLDHWDESTWDKIETMVKWRDANYPDGGIPVRSVGWVVGETDKAVGLMSVESCQPAGNKSGYTMWVLKATIVDQYELTFPPG